MRIAYVTETYPPEINGVALTAARSVAHLRRRGHAVDVIRPRQSGEARGDGDGEWRAGGCAIPMYRDLRFGYASGGALAARLEAGRAELVHAATEGPLGWAAVAAARRLGLPTTSDFRTNFHVYSRYYRLGWLAPAISAYLRRFHNRTDRSFAPTRRARDELVAAGFERVEVVGRGVDLERFAPQRRDAALRRDWSPAAGPVLLYVGRVAAEKNVALALHAFGCARAAVPSARMVVVGDGPLRARLERAHPDVRFVGMQTGDALAAHYASADLFVFPSQSETFGNVTLEALACGLPVVAFDLAAASEYVVDRVNGRLVRPDDADGFATATARLARRHPALGPMRDAARRAAEGADWDAALGRFEQQLAEVVDAHRQHRAAAACVA